MFQLLFAASLAAALPHPLVSVGATIDLDNPVDNAPEAAPTLEACAPRAPGAGPLTIPDTAEAFVANTAFSELADGAATPEGYSQVFQDLQGSTLQLADYLQLYVSGESHPGQDLANMT